MDNKDFYRDYNKVVRRLTSAIIAYADLHNKYQWIDPVHIELNDKLSSEVKFKQATGGYLNGKTLS